MLQQYACGNNHKVKSISQKKKKDKKGKKLSWKRKIGPFVP